MGRVGLVGAVALVAALAAGCGDTPTPKFAPPPSSSAAPGDPTTTPAADPLPPVMPDAAKAHTVAGAKAFVEYVLATLNYSETTLDAEALVPLFSKGCAGCTGIVTFVRNVSSVGGTLTGGRISGSNYAVTTSSGKAHHLTAVELSYHSTRQVVRIPGHRTKVYPDDSAPLTLILSARGGGGWRITSWEAGR